MNKSWIVSKLVNDGSNEASHSALWTYFFKTHHSNFHFFKTFKLPWFSLTSYLFVTVSEPHLRNAAYKWYQNMFFLPAIAHLGDSFPLTLISKYCLCFYCRSSQWSSQKLCSRLTVTPSMSQNEVGADSRWWSVQLKSSYEVTLCPGGNRTATIC